MSVRDLLMSFSSGATNAPVGGCNNTVITASDATANDYFGYYVSLSADGSTAIIGAYKKTVNGLTSAGAAYIFTNVSGTWTQVTELTGVNAASGDRFGFAVSLSADGSTAIIGAVYKTVNGLTSAGAAYIFTNVSGTWTQVADLTASDAASRDRFGFAVSLSADGSTAIIGAYNKTVNGASAAGAAYIFSNVSGTWTQVADLTASDAAGFDQFGAYVSISADGNTAAIGAYAKTVNGVSGAGAAYIFTNVSGTWTQVTELTGVNAASGDNFGSAVSLNAVGDTVIVGTPFRTINGVAGAGITYVFTNTSGTWTQVAELTTNDGDNGYSFGNALSLSADGNSALVTAYNKTVNGLTSVGAAYIFTNVSGVWTQVTQLVASDAATGDNFGYSASMSSDGNEVLIGAYNNTINGLDYAGTAYVFSNYTGVWCQE